MKKIVPDPPPILCVGPNLSHHEAITHAENYLSDAIAVLKLLPPQPATNHQVHLTDAIRFLRVSKAMLTLAQAKTSMTVPI
ncbi:hypothetical protein V0R50_13185 [Pseudomonas sp. 148P]|uniref:DUF3077 domain-containing protein n=1 Tax=Pseudomonas ulcerans TaxID=3115852 RepID=A0ABU7HRL8_9PSED|nr:MULTISPECIES: hypothetical protein [unclassified Pseudomonas]MEE1923219.1 hypothetical protein [Pseudomonas sp. 147P]MEE1934181.1 hypothetical protein [Pseudomonas sp. 148P]